MGKKVKEQTVTITLELPASVVQMMINTACFGDDVADRWSLAEYVTWLVCNQEERLQADFECREAQTLAVKEAESASIQ